MTDELLTAAAAAIESYFTGEFKVRRSIRADMENLRAAVNAETKRRAQADTTTITRPAREHA